MGEGGLLTAGLLFRSKLVPNPLQGHFSHEEGDGKITLVPVPTGEQDEHTSHTLRTPGPATRHLNCLLPRPSTPSLPFPALTKLNCPQKPALLAPGLSSG